MTNKIQYISYLILISIFINQGDGRWKEREKEELRKDFMAYKKFKEKLQKHIQGFYKNHPRELLFANEETRYLKDLELDFFKQALQTPKNATVKLKTNPIRVTKNKHNSNVVQPINQKMDELLKKSSLSELESEQRGSYPGWPTFQDLLSASGKKYDWKNDRWIKVKKKHELVSLKEDENAIHYYVKHEFKYKVLKANKTNNKRKNVVVVTAVR